MSMEQNAKAADLQNRVSSNGIQLEGRIPDTVVMEALTGGFGGDG